MITTPLRELFDLYVLPLGRRQFAMKDVARRCEGAGHAALGAEARALVAFDAETRRLLRERTVALSQQVNPLLAPLDAEVDRGVGAVVRTLQNAIGTLGGETAAAAQAMQDDLFPGGATAITLLSYEEEVEAVDDLLEAIAAQYTELVADIGAAPYVKRLGELNASFRALLEERPPVPIDGKLAALRHSQAHDRMVSIVAGICGLHRTDDPADFQARNHLLQPVLLQNARLAEGYRRRRPVADVHEDTGEELEPEANTPPAPPTPA